MPDADNSGPSEADLAELDRPGANIHGLGPDVGEGKNAAFRGSGMDFGQALDALKEGQRVERAGWNGKSMFLFLVNGSTFSVNRPPLLGIYEEGTVIDYRSHIDMKTADGSVVPWVASQTDLLAEDWSIAGTVAAAEAA